MSRKCVDLQTVEKVVDRKQLFSLSPCRAEWKKGKEGYEYVQLGEYGNMEEGRAELMGTLITVPEGFLDENMIMSE